MGRTLPSYMEFDVLSTLYQNSLSYKYGYYLPDGKFCKDSYGKIFEDNYRTISSVPEFLKSNTGICWDYLIYQYLFMTTTYDLNTKYYYIELDDRYRNTHTFSITKIKDKYYYLETSLYHHKGITHYDSSDEAIFDALEKFNTNIHRFTVFEINMDIEYCNLSPNEFRTKVKENGKLLKLLPGTRQVYEIR